MENWGLKVAAIRRRVKEERPLIHHLTNVVVTNLTANITLAVGAAPVMAYSEKEVSDMVRLAQALVLNMGTPDDVLVEAMLLAGRTANREGVPVIFDPVGAGATPYRTEIARKILGEVRVDVLRGNSSEISATAGFGGRTRGVDAQDTVLDPAEIARKAAQKFNTVAVVTGPVDYVSDGQRLLAVENGHELLGAVTGTGCSATTVIATFRAVEADGVVASAAALSYYGLAAEKAAEACRGPGSFQEALWDMLYTLEGEELARGVRIREVAV